MIVRVVLVLALWLGGLAPARAQCAGDCDGNNAVGVNELVRGVGIALGVRELDACPSFDTNGNDRVAVNELIAAVGNALRGCPTLAGRYAATVSLDGGESGAVDLSAGDDGSVTGTLVIEAAAGGQGGGGATSVSLSGSFDPVTGMFEISGSFVIGGGEPVTVRLSGILGGAFTLEIGGRSYSASLTRLATPTPTRTATPTVPPGTVHTVIVGQTSSPFDPDLLVIDPGDTVTWIWVDGPHSVRSGPFAGNGLPACTPDGIFASAVQSTGTFSRTFTTPGRYAYHCAVAGHCDNFESAIIEVRGTPTASPTRTATLTATIAVPTPTPTAEIIDGVSSAMLGTLHGTAKILEQTYPATLQIEVNGGVVTVTDASTPAPFLFPNTLPLTIVSVTSLLFDSAGPPPKRLALSLNEAGHVVGRYTVTDPVMPQLPVDFDVVR